MKDFINTTKKYTGLRREMVGVWRGYRLRPSAECPAPPRGPGTRRVSEIAISDVAGCDGRRRHRAIIKIDFTVSVKIPSKRKDDVKKKDGVKKKEDEEEDEGEETNLPKGWKVVYEY